MIESTMKPMMTEADAWQRLMQLASGEFSDSAARIQEGAETVGEVPEWAGLVALIATSRARVSTGWDSQSCFRVGG